MDNILNIGDKNDICKMENTEGGLRQVEGCDRHQRAVNPWKYLGKEYS